MDAFAVAKDLGARLNRVFVGDEVAWIDMLLADASAYLRSDVLGLQVYPPSQSTFTVWPDGGRIDLPQQPVVSVDAVARAGVPLDFTRRDTTLWVDGDDAVQVTFTYGFEAIPESLKRWACVLASQVLIPLEQGLGLTAGGLSSVAVDDFKAAWANAGEESGITLTDRNIALLRSQFGVQSGFVVTTR